MNPLKIEAPKRGYSWYLENNSESNVTVRTEIWTRSSRLGNRITTKTCQVLYVNEESKLWWTRTNVL